MIKTNPIVFAAPIALIGTTVLVTLATRFREKQSSWFTSLGIGIISAGAVTAVVEFFCLAELLVKGTDGPGGLIAIILPGVTVLFTSILGGGLMTFGGLLSAQRQARAQTLSSEAQAILRGDPRYFKSLRPVPVQASWREFARKMARSA